MGDFNTIYKILAILKNSMDGYEFDRRLFLLESHLLKKRLRALKSTKRTQTASLL